MKIMMTLESKETIKIGMEIRFAELWDGNGNGEELLESGTICIGEDEDDMPVIVRFRVINQTSTLDTTVKVVDIY